MHLQVYFIYQTQSWLLTYLCIKKPFENVVEKGENFNILVTLILLAAIAFILSKS